MPKSPILYREAFYDVLNDGSYRDLDWNLVNTSIGACMEPRSLLGFGTGKITNIDVVDASINKRSQLDEDTMYRLMGTAGRLFSIDFNY